MLFRILNLNLKMLAADAAIFWMLKEIDILQIPTNQNSNVGCASGPKTVWGFCKRSTVVNVWGYPLELFYVLLYFIEYGLQAKPSILYRAIVFFAATRNDNYNYYRRNCNYNLIIGGFIIIFFCCHKSSIVDIFEQYNC